MTSLSVTMIVRDGAATLGRVLEHAGAFCDELVVVDTGSRDDSRAIAKAAGARLAEFPWRDDFAAARNASLDLCRGDWVMWLDADDVVPAASRAAVEELVLDDRLDAVTAPYQYGFDPVTDACVTVVPRERLARRVPGLRWVGAVHEVLAVPGDRREYRADLVVEHRPAPGRSRGTRNLDILERAVRQGDRSRRTLFYYARELRDLGRDAEAVDQFTAYLADPGATWEHHAALLCLAACHARLGNPDAQLDALHAALRVDPSRAEAHLALGTFHADRAQWPQALPYFSAAASTTPPTTGFITLPAYTWHAWDHLSLCLANLDRQEEAITAALHSLRLGNPDRKRLLDNINWSARSI
ncbi:glycosyltransferase family 2 protein [Actinokineospora terrae]|uniref:Tetratricopeptide repeat-containing protein n=1 Tax=Actinokineospora terrae TaxID=155974 RepID=A0A1H9LP02_9PSEU|nr:glycosyltransferase family 2 protein [Actinokineospora terrae]SER12959.1 Tetratricopeptide repeat-containing protein [Actinokineospora terrae]